MDLIVNLVALGIFITSSIVSFLAVFNESLSLMALMINFTSSIMCCGFVLDRVYDDARTLVVSHEKYGKEMLKLALKEGPI